jgi:hypothetical protein
MSDRMDIPTTKERIHIALGKSETEILDEFRLAARLVTRSDAMRRLIRVALEGNLPEDHLQIIGTIKNLKQRVTASLLEPKTRHAQITLDPIEVDDVSRYQDIAAFTSKSVTIRYLLHASLGKQYPPEHLTRLNQMKT